MFRTLRLLKVLSMLGYLHAALEHNEEEMYREKLRELRKHIRTRKYTKEDSDELYSYPNVYSKEFLDKVHHDLETMA